MTRRAGAYIAMATICMEQLFHAYTPRHHMLRPGQSPKKKRLLKLYSVGPKGEIDRPKPTGAHVGPLPITSSQSHLSTGPCPNSKHRFVSATTSRRPHSHLFFSSHKTWRRNLSCDDLPKMSLHRVQTIQALCQTVESWV